ncbi:MAG TPA: hypothetical protein VFT50_07035 [Baekduia sp.]|nr:hypothetical protein [Baekduia sp.]
MSWYVWLAIILAAAFLVALMLAGAAGWWTAGRPRRDGDGR